MVWQQCAAGAAADLSPCVFSLSPCRLLLLQVMPLSHLHPSHSLLVQTCLVLYLSALLPYPQVRKALELQSGIGSEEQCPALLFSTRGIDFSRVEVGKVLRSVLQGKAKQVFNKPLLVHWFEFAYIFKSRSQKSH